MKKTQLWDPTTKPDSLRKIFLERVKERATFLGVAVCLTTYLTLIIACIICVNLNWISSDVAMGWGAGGLFLCPFAGFVTGYVYYTVVAWRDL